MQNTVRSAVWTTAAVLALASFGAAWFSGEVSWIEAAAYATIAAAAAGAFELWRWLKGQGRVYRAAFSVGLVTGLLLFWVNGAVGIIGSEDNPANLMYGAVFAVGLIGSLVSRFEPRGMARTLLISAVVQALVPVFALTIWPARASWGNAGVVGVLILSSVFAALFALSALLFRRAANPSQAAKGVGAW